MGHKVNPIGFRVGIYKDWSSRWYGDKDYAKFLHADIQIRKFIKGKLKHAGVSKVNIERTAGNTRVVIYTAKPGIVIGKKGSEIDVLKKDIAKFAGKDVDVDIQEVRRPDIDAQLVAENVALQLERRVAFRRAMKKTVTTALKLGAKGIKVMCAGRLGGAEIARTEWYREGRVPLHTLRADIDYGFAEALTTYGKIGIKVWIFKGEIMPESIAVSSQG
ncbi:MAG: 30S ribosomal protein S3 [Deltaproteobacteria bacterium RIFCSPLOWO2_12_FULL_43_16]|nr:MAG: 30S ribosomal protein S3 [Deltaproteobacteria bacterium GWA2_43_19]OGQ10919.1 MAG: 30S ribosomal protein S3 [Deltaproteobacteria bacterium RIFCSPHIGHO2_02_FULL_43_33]OGQ44499.1 MAG: 30S ribosomal protein S3 [Deltaproteobacteria bacterium RIFCSPLOWO2_01_FULL_42_9]OGQ60932.1 MAG: 30S ribosomal protein S3 [Deltaproteobacteria bacterium RIFCSPLOWO2_12_FULL_43_16]HBR17337.1 30S ribosomal protein S3 [Deltaproteobacteria bacterium]